MDFTKEKMIFELCRAFGIVTILCCCPCSNSLRIIFIMGTYYLLGLIMCKQDLKEMLVSLPLLIALLLSEFVIGCVGRDICINNVQIMYVIVIISYFLISIKLMGMADVLFNLSSFTILIMITLDLELSIYMFLFSILLSTLFVLIYKHFLSIPRNEKSPYIPALYMSHNIVFSLYLLSQAL